MPAQQIHIVKDASGLRGTIHWQPQSWKWPLFGFVFSLIEMILYWIGDLGMALVGSPFVAYMSASVAFNRTEVRIDEKRVSWMERPFPTKRLRRLKIKEMDSWVFGRSSSSGKSDSSSISYSVAARRTSGKFLLLVDNLQDLACSKEIATQLAEHTRLKAVHVVSVRNAKSGTNDAWILLAVLVGFLAVAWLVIWSANQS